MLTRATLAVLLLPSLVLGEGEKGGPVREPDAGGHLTPAQRRVLADQGFVVGDKTYKQVFTPYVHAHLPVFITSDSLLNAFHVLLEESVSRLERANAARLPVFLEFALARLDKAAEGVPAKPAQLAAAKRRARIVLGTALRLHKEEAGSFDKATARVIDAEAARVTAARAVAKPEWLGPPDRGFTALDYSRFRPRGLYTRTPALQRYFRVVSWLQAIPFRVEKDEELLAAFLIARAAVIPDEPKMEPVRRGKAVLDGFGAFLGSGDDWGLGAFYWELKPLPVERLRAYLLERAKGDGRPRVNDHLAFLPDNPGDIAEVSIRLAAAYRLPDAVLFQRITDSRGPLKRAWPGGLDVLAALGSPHARRHLLRAEGKEHLAVLEANKVLFREARRDEDAGRRPPAFSIYSQYLACLGTLVATAEPDWPAFMKGEAWQAKTSQTALAGWAQMRHTWALQAKLLVTYIGGAPESSGFVEPVPEFYRTFGLLCGRVRWVLPEAGAFGDDRAFPRDSGEWNARERLGMRVIQHEWLLEILEKADLATRGAAAYVRLSEEDKQEVRRLTRGLGKPDPGGLEKPEQFRAYLDDLRRERDEQKRKLEEWGQPLEVRWEDLRECCTRLEILSHKQLRGRPFADEEQRFLKGYGKRLAKVMFYNGNSYLDPRDDAPRVVDVFAREERFLEVAISRPRPIYVLYPWHGKKVLCRGAILPYHEWVHTERLTDEQWRRALGRPGWPPPLPWTKVLTEGAGR